jgi:hypothetical protein
MSSNRYQKEDEERKRKDCFIRVWVMWNIKPSKRRRWGRREERKEKGREPFVEVHTHAEGERRG